MTVIDEQARTGRTTRQLTEMLKFVIRNNKVSCIYLIEHLSMADYCMKLFTDMCFADYPDIPLVITKQEIKFPNGSNVAFVSANAWENKQMALGYRHDYIDTDHSTISLFIRKNRLGLAP